MGKCKDCKFWDTAATEWSGYKSVPDVQVCSKVVGEDEKNALEIAYTIGHYGHESGLVTRADFGCVLFEKK